MAKCRLCDHSNPPGVERCEKCGTWIGEVASEAAPAQATPDQSPGGDAPTPDSLEGRVLAAMQAGRKIDAVKIYRAERNVGLKEAKDAVEELAREHGIAVASGGGCAGVVLLALIIGGALAAALCC